MTNNFRALCADLIEAVLSDDSHIDCTEIARRARAALADEPPEPIPPADGEAAECTAELEGQKPRPDYDRVQKIATEAQIRSAAQYLAKKQHCDGDLIPAIRYAIARWGNPAPQPADGEVAELVEMLKGIAYWKRHGKPGEPAPTSFDIRQADRLDRAAELLQRQVLVPVPVSERPWEREEWCDTNGLCWLGSDALDGCTPTWLYGPPAWAERFPNVHRVLLPAHALPLPEVDQMTWQPIDTAPRDGTEILASDYDAIEIVSWVGPMLDVRITGEWTNREGEAMYPAWWQPLPDHLPLPEVGE